MTLKTYIAKSVVSLAVSLTNSIWAWVAFKPLPNGTSKFLTTSAELQAALENNPKYGKLFTLEGSQSVEKDITEPTVSYYSVDENLVHQDFYFDVYVGVGNSVEDVMIEANHHNMLTKGSAIPITADNTYLWVILPYGYTPLVQMSSLNVPMTEQESVTQGNVTYKVLRSQNQYAETFSIELV